MGSKSPPPLARGVGALGDRENDLIHAGYTLAIVDRNGSSLHDRAVRLFEIPGHTMSDYYEPEVIELMLAKSPARQTYLRNRETR